MAIEVFPDSPISVGMSPRISFSHDLPQNDVVPIEQYVRSSTSSSNIDFDFCVFRETFDQESSSADELFFDGKILPIEIKKRLAPSKRPPPSPLPPTSLEPTRIQDKTTNTNEKKSLISESDEKQSNSKSSSFWRFKRSSSCGNGYGRTLCPLPLLSRSNSTGSTASSAAKRPSVSSSNNQKQNFGKYSAPNSSLKQQQPQSAYSSRPPLKKNSSSYGFYSNGVKFNPVLNVPPANMFGLGTFFSSGKDKSRKK